MKPKNWFESLNCAIEGILHTAKTQRHMKAHFFVAALAFFLGLFLDISRMEFIILSLSITLVLFAEMINTAIEETINLIHEEYHPLAKIVKDAAAGGVLIASFGAIVMGYWILSKPLFSYVETGITAVKRAPEFVTIISLVVVILVVVIMKSHFGKGTPLHGGMPSGHAAVSFAVWTSVALITVDPFISILTLLLAVMVSHSRLLLGIHRTREVFLGGLLGFLTTLLFFQLFT
ncbi:MAG: diacylglycerol kinase [Proteobacteria bacterium]|nr:diacylglycerol kinase [Pseudomonadota bacterium]